MCDQDQLAEMGKIAKSGGVSRREFAAMGAVATVIACAPMDSAEAQGAPVRETSSSTCRAARWTDSSSIRAMARTPR